jgi:hypothetical protein
MDHNTDFGVMDKASVWMENLIKETIEISTKPEASVGTRVSISVGPND